MDMAGGVQEWTMDWYEANYHSKSPATGPPGGPEPASTFSKIIRGASFAYVYSQSTKATRATRAAYRTYQDAHKNSYITGFRCVRPLK